MVNNLEIKKCKGCGTLLQITNEQTVGYVQKQHLNTGRCQRCFRIKQYSDFQKIDINNQELLVMLERFVQERATILHVIDITDLLGTCLFEMKHFIGNHKIILVVNKIDVISRKMRRYDIWYDYIQTVFKAQKIPIEEIFFVSAKEILGIRILLEYLEEFENNNEIKIVGNANVGKSSLIQAFFQEQQLDLHDAPTIFATPGTTINELVVPLKTLTVYDTPGIMQPKQLTYHIPTKMLKPVLINNVIKPKNYQIYEPQTFYIGGYVQINIKVRNNNTITFFCSNPLPIHRQKYTDNDEFFLKHYGSLLSPPIAEELTKVPHLLERTSHRFLIKRNKTDIVISGLGWISVNKKAVDIEVIVPKGVYVYKQNALV